MTQANPPFVPYIMNAMAERICNMLDNADEKSAPLSFVIFIPGWEECESWERIKGSSFLRGQLLLAADDHGYCDGASHQRKDSFRASCYDTGRHPLTLFVTLDVDQMNWNPASFSVIVLK